MRLGTRAFYDWTPMRRLRQVSPLFLSLGVHALAVGLVIGVSELPDLGYGAGEEDLGGDAAGAAEIVAEGPDEDYGPAPVKLVGIGIVVDAPSAPAAVAPPVASAPSAPQSPPKPAAQPPDPVPAAPAPKPPEPSPAPPDAAPPAPGPAETPVEPGDGVADAEAPAEIPAANPHQQGHGLKKGEGRKVTGKGHRHDCPVNPRGGVKNTSPTSWVLERDLVEFYAGHLKELMKLGSVRANRTEAGKLDGFRVGVAKCSVLRETGFRTGDVVQDVNGVEVHDLLGAVGAYLKLRKEKHFEVHLVRRGKPLSLTYDLE